MTARTVAISTDHYLFYVGRALDGMLAIAAELGDERACARPDLPGANTAYGLLTHCLGVTDYWGGQVVAGRTVERDRPAEFAATGTVAELAEHCRVALARLERDLATCDPAAPVRRTPDAWALGPGRVETQGSALFHLYEELAQHHGQLEVLRDVLTRPVTA